ncbi:MAG TPA: ASPIC/UnbV domain-containing protein [Streptosporangiaceae bacterium]
MIAYVVAGDPALAGGATQTAAQYSFKQLPIAMPPGYNEQKFNNVRPVNPAYYHIRSWISAVGASVAINDLTGHGRSDGMCIVDTRTNDVIVTYTPTAPAEDRFAPFVLNPAPLPVNSTMAPTGCLAGDFTGSGRMDLLVFFWGRSPILYLLKPGAKTLSPSAYQPQELLTGVDQNGQYDGPQWNTDAVAVADLAGTGHPDIIVGNYFPDSGVLDTHGQNDVAMPNSLSNATNGGGVHMLRWTGATQGPTPSVTYVPAPGAIPFGDSTGWTLALGTADLTGSGRPDLYIGNDFGHGHLLYNESTASQLKFVEVVNSRTPTTPKSFVLNNGSFKGMGVDFGDMSGHGQFDFMVSNITQPWGLEESNLVFVNTATSKAQLTQDLNRGYAPFAQNAQQLGLAWVGWAWDVKMGDFLNNGNLNVLQAVGFVQGNINRWNWLQEMAMTNDDLIASPSVWPNVQPGDDISGHTPMAFFAKSSSGEYVNLTRELGLANPTPTRGIAMADTTGTGRLDFAIARQWGPPAFYANESPAVGHSLTLNLYRPLAGGTRTGLAAIGTPAYGSTVLIKTPGHQQISQLDGGSGHDGYRSFQVRFGLGSYSGPVSATIQWHDNAGALHQQTVQLAAGTHNLMLTSTVKEVSGS